MFGIGTRTEISLDNLSSLDASMRLTTAKEEDRTVVYASKGTLSDGLYALRAFFCPSFVRKEEAANLARLKDAIKNQFKEDIGSAFSTLARTKDEGKAAPLKVSCITVGVVKNALNISKFKTNTLPNIFVENYNKSSNEIQGKSLEAKEKTFDTDLNNFLDQNPNVSQGKLTTYLDNYAKRYYASVKGEESSTLSNKEALSSVSFKQKVTFANTVLIYKFKDLSQEIADVGRDGDKFFKLLTKLSDKTTPITSSEKKILSPDERGFFIRTLLENQTILEDNRKDIGKQGLNNNDVYSLLTDLGTSLVGIKGKESLSKEEQSRMEAHGLKAKNLLERDNKRSEKIQQNSSSIKERVLAYQDYAKKERAAGKTPAPMKLIKGGENPANDPITRPLLSPDARGLLETIVARCLPEEKPTDLHSSSLRTSGDLPPLA